MALEAVLSAIGTMISVGQTVFSLYEASNAQGSITLADSVRLINSVNVKLFANLEFAAIETARDDFYKDDLPMITKQKSISQAQITGSGFLTQNYHNIRDGAKKVWGSLRNLDWILKYNNLHVDDCNFFARLMGEGHILLLHMHSVVLNLRSIELIGRVSLDHYQLESETRTLLKYLEKGQIQMNKVYDHVGDLRLSEISKVESRADEGLLPSIHHLWIDHYSKLSSTPEDQKLDGNGVPSSYSGVTNIFQNQKQEVVNRRGARVEYIRGIYWRLTGGLLANLSVHQSQLFDVIEKRLRKQEEQSKSMLMSACLSRVEAATADELAAKVEARAAAREGEEAASSAEK